MGNHASKHIRSKEQIADDKKFITPLLLRGYTGYDIMAEVNAVRPYALTITTVYADMRAVIADWHRERKHMMDKYVTIQMAKLDHYEKIYMDLFLLSAQGKKSTKIKKYGKAPVAPPIIPNGPVAPAMPSIDKVATEINTVESLGDPRWMDGVRWCWEKRTELLLKFNKKHKSEDDEDGEIDGEQTPANTIVNRQIMFVAKPRPTRGVEDAEIIID